MHSIDMIREIMDSKLGKEGNENMRELMGDGKVAHHWIEVLGKIEELLNCSTRVGKLNMRCLK